MYIHSLHLINVVLLSIRVRDYSFVIFLNFQRSAKRAIEHDAPIARYYERLATMQGRGSQASHQVSQLCGCL